MGHRCLHAAASHTSPLLTQDVRLRLLGEYLGQSVPYSERIRARYVAVKHSLLLLLRQAAQGTIHRDMAFLAVMWYLVMAVEGYSSNTAAVFATLFELVSAFGNVGLSLGSIREPSAVASYSRDFSVSGKVLCMVVQLVGRTRDFPSKVDSSLTVRHRIDPHEILEEQTREPGALSPLWSDACSDEQESDPVGLDISSAQSLVGEYDPPPVYVEVSEEPLSTPTDGAVEEQEG
ncbi:hypothetical protein CYMTET_23089 [Cymbomonas tetramitiformis]|uniref:Uncharacterized protein n=1 Tax=Cymbomonas tetramitiformis TaxID=36881 RepID=A0AAE0FYW2_9CHLO|nr:hypothetical protein CYMTET_23089 [Cymbomonas tetramitiformis]